MIYFLLRSRMPTTTETRVLDMCLITLMEHGMTPHVIVTRLTQLCNPGQPQVAMAAGLACVGDQFAGTMDGCGRILEAGLKAADPAAFCAATVTEHRTARRPMPGFGHNLHKPDDPRSPRLFALARAAGVKGDAIALLEMLAAELDRQAGRHLTINATGALAALMLEIDIPVPAMRCLAVLSRAGGLAAHVMEESETKSRHVDLAQRGRRFHVSRRAMSGASVRYSSSLAGKAMVRNAPVMAGLAPSSISAVAAKRSTMPAPRGVASSSAKR